ncbi:MAG: hypothetical protein ACO32I_08385, partial [Candidatus Limnocylindrus sp.]
ADAATAAAAPADAATAAAAPADAATAAAAPADSAPSALAAPAPAPASAADAEARARDLLAKANAVLALRKAMMFDELMSKRDQIRPKIMQKAKPMKGGAASTPQSAKVGASKAALSRLANSGSHKDAAAVFEQFLD